jgi:hypothetical protein
MKQFSVMQGWMACVTIQLHAVVAKRVLAQHSSGGTKVLEMTKQLAGDVP